MTDEQMREVAGQWLSPVDQIFADLIDKSYTMTAGAFQIEVQQVIDRIPQLFFLLDKRALETSLKTRSARQSSNHWSANYENHNHSDRTRSSEGIDDTPAIGIGAQGRGSHRRSGCTGSR